MSEITEESFDPSSPTDSLCDARLTGWRGSMRALIAFGTAMMLVAGTPVLAAPCKDPKTGKFVKCPEAAKKPVRCKDAKGKFAKCSAPGAKPV
jgi:hypothetical protein